MENIGSAKMNLDILVEDWISTKLNTLRIPFYYGYQTALQIYTNNKNLNSFTLTKKFIQYAKMNTNNDSDNDDDINATTMKTKDVLDQDGSWIFIMMAIAHWKRLSEALFWHELG